MLEILAKRLAGLGGQDAGAEEELPYDRFLHEVAASEAGGRDDDGRVVDEAVGEDAANIVVARASA